MERDQRQDNRRDQQTNFMLTKDEKARLDAWRNRRGMSASAACRYFVLRGLDMEEGE